MSAQGKTGTSLSQQAMAARPTPYLKGLNDAQLQAVETLDGPVLMLAGAGTGKTRALTARIAHLIATGTARPDEILAVTFTNKAAREMKQRIGGLLGMAVEGMPWLGTFHAIGVKLLRRHAELVGLKPNFTILDTDDQIRLLKQEIIAANIDEKRWPARALAAIIDNWKNRGWRPESVPGAEADAFNSRGTELYAAYQERLKALNAVDFGDLLLHVVTIFQQNPDILARYQRWLRFILVDEYQDTNVVQYMWLRLLAAGHSNICCVGDDDQSIYGWRGAEVGNILRFEKDFPGAQVIRLEQNYRSTPHILAAASGVIAGNEGRLGKTLWTEVEGGEKVRLIGHWDGEEEARWIGEDIEALERGTRGLRFNRNQMAILVRASHQMRAFEDRFLSIGLPYRVIGGPRFYERMEIRDAMAYFRLVVSPADGMAFERIVNTPKRGLGEKAQQTIRHIAREADVPLLEGARAAIERDVIKGKGGSALELLVRQLQWWHFLIQNKDNSNEIRRYQTEVDKLEIELGLLRDDFEKLTSKLEREEDFDAELTNRLDVLRAEVEQVKSQLNWNKIVVDILNGDHIKLAEQILDESGYTEMWQNDKSPDAPGRLENLKELVKALEGFENLQGFLEHVALIMENETEDTLEKVTIMTLHAAKGLEFPVVYLPGWEDGLFPSQRSMDEAGQPGLEEERRLAYVGITRAEELCTISFASNRRVYGQWQSQLPSRFIDELPAKHVEVLTPPGLYGGGYGAAAPARAADDGLEHRAATADVYNSPGWKRMQSRRETTQQSPARMVIDAEAQAGFTPGVRVFHQKFGYGTVEQVEGDKLAIAFDKAGQKHVVARFVLPADQAGDVPF